MEIIEFPSILYSTADDRVLDEFTSFVRPTVHPELTDFCRALTGIEQADVDTAQTFSSVFTDHQRWLRSYGLHAKREGQFAFVTCGDWDLRTMLPGQTRLAGSGVDEPPPAYQSWINLKQVVRDRHGPAAGDSLPAMLGTFGLPLVGRHHRGIDDCRNILAIVRALLGADHRLAIIGRRADGD